MKKSASWGTQSVPPARFHQKHKDNHHQLMQHLRETKSEQESPQRCATLTTDETWDHRSPQSLCQWVLKHEVINCNQVLTLEWLMFQVPTTDITVNSWGFVELDKTFIYKLDLCLLNSLPRVVKTVSTRWRSVRTLQDNFLLFIFFIKNLHQSYQLWNHFAQL